MLLVSVFVIWRSCKAFDDASNFIGRNMSGGVRGATLNAAGSSMPELITLLLGILVFGDKNGVAVGIGTIAGSAIYNIAVIPALSIIAALAFAKAMTVEVNQKVIQRDSIWLILIQAVFIFIVSISFLNVTGGVVLTLLYVTYVAMLFRKMKQEQSHPAPLPAAAPITSRFAAFRKLEMTELVLGHKHPHTSAMAWILLAASMVGIGLACWLLVEAVYKMGEAWAIQPYFVAVIIAAAATSIPDTLLSVKDAMRGDYDDAISNAVGSNIFNVSFGIGFPVLIVALFLGVDSNLTPSVLDSVVPLLLMLLPIYMMIGWMLAKWHLGYKTAGALLLTYIGYVVFIMLQAWDILQLPKLFS
jgi:cation:H+ antiporter